MFGIKKERLIISLEKIRQRLCCYSPGSKTCDCKYLYGENKYPDALGENTGCCEVRMAAELIYAMTDKEFKDICKRAGVSL